MNMTYERGTKSMDVVFYMSGQWAYLDEGVEGVEVRRGPEYFMRRTIQCAVHYTVFPVIYYNMLHYEQRCNTLV